jgi:hypothetical protein
VGAVCAPLLLIGVLAWPLLFTAATFNEDWLNHLWYIWHQSLAIRGDRLPSLFLDYSGGVFYPLYAFYGGTLYALAGALSLALGDAPLQSYVVTYLLGFAAAYGGWSWMAHSFGLRGWRAHVPGLVFLTSASYLMLIYGLGDWPEFLAVSAMPLMIAAGLSVLRADRLRFPAAFALAASAPVFFGSHLLTVIWGSTILALVGLAILACVPAARGALTRTGAMRVLGLLLPAFLVSAWFLLPTAAYESQTVIAASYPHFRELLRASMYTVAVRNLFTLSRARASGSVVTLSLPVLAMAWVALVIPCAACARRRGTWMRVLLVLCAATVLVAVAMTHAGIVLALPRLYATLQFGFRLESYVLLGVSGAVLAGLVLLSGGERAGDRGESVSGHSGGATDRSGTAAGSAMRFMTWALVPVLAVSIFGAIEQVGSYTPGRNRDSALSSYLEPTYEQEGLLDYVDDRLPVLRRPLPRVAFAVRSAPGGRSSVVVHEPAGRLVDTNIRSTPDLLHVTGARIVGTDSEADDVLEVGRGGRISIGPANTLPVVLGRWLSGIAILVLALELLWPALRRLRPAAGHFRDSPPI